MTIPAAVTTAPAMPIMITYGDVAPAISSIPRNAKYTTADAAPELYRHNAAACTGLFFLRIFMTTPTMPAANGTHHSHVRYGEYIPCENL